jgi:hypothetical protein
LVDLVVIAYVFPNFGMSYQEKYGNPDYDRSCDLAIEAVC